MAAYGSNRKYIIGAILVGIGVLFLFDNFNPGFLPYWLIDNIISWPTVFIAIGVIIYINTGNKKAAAIMTAIGIFGFIPKIWPLFLVAAGVYLIMRKDKAFSSPNLNFGSSGKAPDEGSINDTAIFGGTHKVYQLDKFSGGKIIAIFGGSEIDLRECGISEAPAVVDVITIFGGSSLMIPRDWTVEIDAVPIFGGFGDKRMKEPGRAYDPNKIMKVKGLALFGGIEINN